MDTISQILAQELSVPLVHVENVIRLLDEGNTVPFIARYRKEMHGTMDDQVIRTLADRLAYLRNLEVRRQEVYTAIESQGMLTDTLRQSILQATTLAEVDDLYRPYRPKRRTRASVAKERGLQPLADLLLAGEASASTEDLALPYIHPENALYTVSDVLAGASDILAEQCADDAALRAKLRHLIHRTGILVSTAQTDADSVYRLYYDFRHPVSRLQSHQILAINRGERENLLKISLETDDIEAVATIARAVLTPRHPHIPFLREMAQDAWKRLLLPSLTRELRTALTDTANEQAIASFAANLRPLLMQPPVKNKVTLGLDPAYRTGCKLAVVDETGKVLETGVIYPTPPHNKIEESKKILQTLCQKHQISCIAIGNGTASRESEQFIANFIRESGLNLSYMVVNEAGASVYSASKLGAEEFPDFDVSLRSAVSIARRLQDPLAELVKIDPKSIGVGQYQHDMPQARLAQALDGVVEDCVNAVGVDLNTASPALLARVAGISHTVANHITAYRAEHGAFTTRRQLLQVSKLGPKTFEQCAGFLRIPESTDPLDRTAVHPESYAAASALLTHCGYTLTDDLSQLPERIEQLGWAEMAKQCGVGIPTLRDIAAELQKPGRDPRDALPPPLLRADVLSMEDLKAGMQLNGTVRNVCDFGAFVDIGVHQDGLVHISELSDHFIRRPADAVQVGDVVSVVVLSVDVPRKRISLSIKRAK